MRLAFKEFLNCSQVFCVRVTEILDPALVEKVRIHCEISKNGQKNGSEAIEKRSKSDSDDQLTVQELAERLNLSIWTVYRWAASGRLPCIRLSKRSLRSQFRRSRNTRKNHHRQSVKPTCISTRIHEHCENPPSANPKTLATLRS